MLFSSHRAAFACLLSRLLTGLVAVVFCGTFANAQDAAQPFGPGLPTQSLLRHEQLGSGELMLDDRGNLVGLRGRGRLTGKKACDGAFHVRLAALVPDGAEISAFGCFTDETLTQPWTIDDQAVVFRAEPSAGAWAQRDILPAVPGFSWRGFLSNPLQPGAATGIVTEYTWVASFQGYPQRTAIDAHATALLVGTVEDGEPAGDNLLYLYWNVYSDEETTTVVERRSFRVLAGLLALTALIGALYLRAARGSTRLDARGS